MNRIIINDVTIEAPAGSNVSVINGRVLVNGKPYDGLNKDEKLVSVVVHGSVGWLRVDGPAEVKVAGDVTAGVTAGNNVECRNVTGDVSAANNVSCIEVGGSVTAGNNASCGAVGGSVKAGNNVAYRK